MNVMMYWSSMRSWSRLTRCVTRDVWLPTYTYRPEFLNICNLTARICLDQALQKSMAFVLHPAFVQRVRATNQRFAAELGRVEVGARRT